MSAWVRWGRSSRSVWMRLRFVRGLPIPAFRNAPHKNYRWPPLRLLAGLEAPTAGSILLSGQTISMAGRILAVVEPSVAGAEAVQLVVNRAQLQTLDADLAVRQLEVETKVRTAGLVLTRAQDIDRLEDSSSTIIRTSTRSPRR